MIKRGITVLGMGLGCWLFYRLGNFLAEACGRWPLALGLVLVITLVAAVVLPGNSGIWAELLGTAGCLPLYLRVVPVALFQPADQVPLIVGQVLYLVLGLLIASLGPMVLLMVCGPLLER